MNYFDVVFNEQMELLIKDFRISLFSIYTSIMESYRSTESSKGIYSIYIGTITYWTINIITNDFIILNCINSFCRYINIGDFIAVLGSIDSVSGSVDLNTTILLLNFISIIRLGSFMSMIVELINLTLLVILVYIGVSIIFL